MIKKRESWGFIFQENWTFEHFSGTTSLIFSHCKVTRVDHGVTSHTLRVILGEKTESRGQEVGEALRALESKKMTKEEGPGGRKKKRATEENRRGAKERNVDVWTRVPEGVGKVDKRDEGETQPRRWYFRVSVCSLRAFITDGGVANAAGSVN